MSRTRNVLDLRPLRNRESSSPTLEGLKTLEAGDQLNLLWQIWKHTLVYIEKHPIKISVQLKYRINYQYIFKFTV